MDKGMAMDFERGGKMRSTWGNEDRTRPRGLEFQSGGMGIDILEISSIA